MRFQEASRTYRLSPPGLVVAVDLVGATPVVSAGTFERSSIKVNELALSIVVIATELEPLPAFPRNHRTRAIVLESPITGDLTLICSLRHGVRVFKQGSLGSLNV